MTGPFGSFASRTATSPSSLVHSRQALDSQRVLLRHAVEMEFCN
jgi:hypothetical protein